MSRAADKPQQKKGIWLQALSDSLAGTSSPQQNMCFSDIHGDGDYVLIIADEKKTLRIWKGANIIYNLTLPAIPSSIFSFYADSTPPITPLVGVVCGTMIFCYKSTKGGSFGPYTKYELPLFQPSAEETSIWEESKKGTLALDEVLNRLDSLQVKGDLITPAAQRLLGSADPQEQEKYFSEVKTKGTTWRFCHFL